mmetsp:Transcript_9494/g.20014  ORF Transcript_9494/g.20014 Transcript_9494/m.20014 type:complete len:439 (+) Transcript_9494:316-1632(+)
MASVVSHGAQLQQQQQAGPAGSAHVSENVLEDIRDESYLQHGVFSDPNNRPYMEDRHISRVFVHRPSGRKFGVFAVFDGHGGEFAAHYLSNTFLNTLVHSPQFPHAMAVALEDTCAQLEREILTKSVELKKYFGSTGVVVVVTDDHIFCTNVGDSRALLSRDGGVVPLSNDHSPLRADEVKRITQAGGFITARGVNNYIGLTRSFGDLDLKGHKHITFPKLKLTADLLTAEPELLVVEKKPVDEILVIASDGLWGRLRNEQALKIARTVLRRSSGDVVEAARRLARVVQNAGSQDNITVIVVILSRESVLKEVTVHGGLQFKNLFGSNSLLSSPMRGSSANVPPVSAVRSSPEVDLEDDDSKQPDFRGGLSSPRAGSGTKSTSLASRPLQPKSFRVLRKLRSPRAKSNSVHGARTASLLDDDEEPPGGRIPNTVRKPN